MPLLALLMPVEVAAPLAVLVSITVAVVIVVEDWEKVHFRSAWRLVLSTLLGIPLGLLLLTRVPGPAVKAILANKELRNQLRNNAKGLKSRYSLNTMVDEYTGILGHVIGPTQVNA